MLASNGFVVRDRRRPSQVVALALSAALTWAWACGGDVTEPPSDPSRPTTVTVSPATPELTALGETLQLRAEVRDQRGNTISGATVTWTSTRTSVATVSRSGLVTAVGNGTATIIATAGAISGTRMVTVAQQVSAVNITPDSSIVLRDATLQLTAEATDANGHGVVGAEFSWASSDTTVADSDETGLVRGIALGRVEVSAASSGLTARAQVEVVEPAPTTLAVTPDTAVFEALGDTVRLLADVQDQIGRTMPDRVAAWATSDTLVATVDSTGLVTAVGNGTATITVTAGMVSDDAAVEVMQVVRSAAVSPVADTLILGDSLRLTAEAYDANGQLAANTRFRWRSIDPTIVTVDNLGLARAVSEGVAEIIVTTAGARGTVQVTVFSPDRAALVAFYHATNGPHWVKNDNWLTTAPLGVWHGVGTDTDGRVTSLNLAGSQDRQSGRSTPQGLKGTIPPELGNLANLKQLFLSTNNLTGPIPPELGNLASLTQLNLGHNQHVGHIPPELGSLANLTLLHLQSNELTGPIPQNFPQLDRLSHLSISGNELLCVPGTSAFAAWLHGIEKHDAGPRTSCNAADVAALKSLFEASGGTSWTMSDGWPGDGPVGEWYGVSADSVGRVTELDLSRNGLVGKLPATLGNLGRMTELRIEGNALSGRLPLSMAQLPLREFHYADTELCVPTAQSLLTWLGAIPSHEGTGVECAPLSDREILEVLYESAAGPNWANNENWLTDSPLQDWYGINVDGQGRVVRIALEGNNLTGSLPPELGNLANLTKLYLQRNELSGPIPPEFGDLASLTFLSLETNELTGPIPPELGKLASLEDLRLYENRLSGTIPSALGKLANLRNLFLGRNGLSGPIPPEFGDLASLTFLGLETNELTGPIPPELGRLASLDDLRLYENRLSGGVPSALGKLANLEFLFLDSNGLTGQLPPGFGALSLLRGLSLAHNSQMTGALPADLTALRQLDALLAPGTGLCAPLDAGFQQWLEGIRTRRIVDCEGDPPIAYLIQAAQSREFVVPLVAGDKALLRVFLTTRHATTSGIPAVRARFYRDGRESHVVDIPGKSGPIPTEVDESSLYKSVNAEIPGSVVQPGLEMVIEVDPDGALDPGLGVAKRIPETGRLAVEVRDMPLFDLMLIPFIWTERHDSSVVSLAGAMADDPENHDMLRYVRTLLPVGDLKVTAHEPVLTSTNNAFELLKETEAIRVIEGGTGYFAGMMPDPITGTDGAATLSGRSSFQGISPVALAHELGHNLSLRHPACHSDFHRDPSYPYANGAIGVWGYDFRDGGSLVGPSTRDLMGGCLSGPPWISDYNFTNALRYRLFDEGAPQFAAAASPARSLLLWGGVRADSVPYLEPAFAVDAKPSLPEAGDDYLLTGRTDGGTQLFSLAFDMPEVADGDGSSSFAFVLPVRPGWDGDLASITLAGPGGSVTLDSESDQPMAILRNSRTGQVRGILRDLPLPSRAAMEGSGQAFGPSLEVLFSRGIPGAEAHLEIPSSRGLPGAVVWHR